MEVIMQVSNSACNALVKEGQISCSHSGVERILTPAVLVFSLPFLYLCLNSSCSNHCRSF